MLDNMKNNETEHENDHKQEQEQELDILEDLDANTWSESRNRDISFGPPIMDKKLWNSMSKQLKNKTKIYDMSYIKFLQRSDPLTICLEWYIHLSLNQLMEKYIKLSYRLNKLYLTQLDCYCLPINYIEISSNYQKLIEKEEVFGKDLNETNKLLNDACMVKKKAAQNAYLRNNL
ncbi:hypothetical protein C1646_769160 [Rhizophagus diaphanus]|nr:hypothetical protein C1646_769160 [Rhizophagus diaphanus] [Rhizophagus sp. MUCL 43196]